MTGVKKILLIDDDKEFLEEFEDMLNASGYAITSINDGCGVVERVCEINPDIILLDLKMKPVSGFEVAGTLKTTKSTLHIPIIAISGYYTVKEHEFLMNICGIKKFFKKPINPEEVIAEIENTLKGGETNAKE